jgi:hypothetical protein
VFVFLYSESCNRDVLHRPLCEDSDKSPYLYSPSLWERLIKGQGRQYDGGGGGVNTTAKMAWASSTIFPL